MEKYNIIAASEYLDFEKLKSVSSALNESTMVLHHTIGTSTVVELDVSSTHNFLTTEQYQSVEFKEYLNDLIILLNNNLVKNTEFKEQDFMSDAAGNFLWVELTTVVAPEFEFEWLGATVTVWDLWDKFLIDVPNETLYIYGALSQENIDEIKSTLNYTANYTVMYV